MLLPVELNSSSAFNSPKFFTKETLGDLNLCRPTERDLANLSLWVKKLDALVIFHDAVYDSSQRKVRDFDINLVCGLNSSQGVVWNKVLGPDSGELKSAQTSEVKYTNPKDGGLYRFDLDLFGKQKVATQALICAIWLAKQGLKRKLIAIAKFLE